MKIAVMQPYFSPYIGYFQLINAVDKFILYDHVNFIKKSWINRNRIIEKKNEISLITIPLTNISSFLKIKDIEIDDTKKWRDKILKTIKISYSKAPYFNVFFPIIEQVIQLQICKLSEFNNTLIRIICEYLQIQTGIDYEFSKANFIENLIEDEKYLELNYNGIEKKIARIIEICKQEKAGIYYNAIGGTKLYPKNVFEDYNIQISFLKTNEIKYKQFINDFIPNLSIIDVLMFNDPEEIRKMLNNYELI